MGIITVPGRGYWGRLEKMHKGNPKFWEAFGMCDKYCEKQDFVGKKVEMVLELF